MVRWLFLLLFLISCTSVKQRVISNSSALTGSNLSNHNVWAKFGQPTQSSGESIGSYSSGCLAGGKKLKSKSSDQVQILWPERKRNYGHPKLLGFIKALSQKASTQLLVGDASQPRGGPMPGGHASHQNGLDVDIYYTLPHNSKPISMISDDGKNILKSKWKTSYEKLLLKVASDERVQRVFVNAAIKKGLCKKYSDVAHLNKVRPWYFHDSHFHVRLKCPESSPHCQSQKPVPNSKQCGETLNWWFSEEALKPWLKKLDKPVQRDYSLPSNCADVASFGEK